MHKHNFHKQVESGITLVETVMGIFLAGVIALVCAGLFKAGIKTYNYAYRQTRVLSSARSAISGNGAQQGMVWATQNATAAQSLSSSGLTLKTVGGSNISFLVSGNNLYQSYLGLSSLQAEGVSASSVTYFNMDSSGLIMISSAPETATLVVSQISMTGGNSNNRTYNFISGAQMRNHQ